MHQTTTPWEDHPPHITLARLIDRHGTWTTLRTLAAVLWRRRPRRPSTVNLPNHLRRDIGLTERDEVTRPLRGPWL